MHAEQRRQAIREILQHADQPVSATVLANRFSVSRQIIVGDIALLHSAAGMEEELNAMVDEGCTVLDVIVEHPVYGQLTGSLQLSSRHDVRQFLDRCARSDARPLSDLTGGIHLHTLSCPDEAAAERVRSVLRELGVLLEG